jgi:hypothetical protein
MTAIDVDATDEGDPYRFRVRLTEGRSTTRHTVPLSVRDAKRLAPDHRPSGLVNAAFRFLLEREPKEAILRPFDPGVIGDYFPEFEERVHEYL